MKNNYYDDKLNSEKLFMVYDTNIQRIRQYLSKEIDYVKNMLSPNDFVLELGAGYGRVIKEIAPICKFAIGIDISKDNVNFSNKYLQGISNAKILEMDVNDIRFDERFDIILCLQNGLSSMNMNIDMIKNIDHILSDDGKLIFSTYSEKFWDTRLKWFQEQADKGLLGEIDIQNTKDGVIVCKDGFKAKTFSHSDLTDIGKSLGYPFKIEEIDESSIFLVIDKK